MIDELIRATTVFPPTLLPVPFKRETVLPCSALMSEYSKTLSRMNPSGFYSFGQAWLRLYLNFASEQLSMVRDVLSAPQNQEFPGKMPPILAAQGGYQPVLKRLKSLAW